MGRESDFWDFNFNFNAPAGTREYHLTAEAAEERRRRGCAFQMVITEKGWRGLRPDLQQDYVLKVKGVEGGPSPPAVTTVTSILRRDVGVVSIAGSGVKYRSIVI